MKKYIIPLILLFILIGCSFIDNNYNEKNNSKPSKRTFTEEKNTTEEKASEETTFEEQLGEMLEEIDNLEFEQEDDGFPNDLK
ncbi:hypothetical protein [Gottfriedia solisilvae]|uniref:Lipoprotein n=1 Tax=Gottfriedia solisilvae TaxID=1516104 RepID=A0A8J3EXZ9_9BACI|nr:hypothetical protein [Gottfriedia solisilvae]GGI15515.1 hypothetical protein GCM10007380_28370 [Gottfriedia solisilvae]